MCAICRESYMDGDCIALSKNSNCPHAFHVHCITDWLMENESCPVCREDYLMFGTSIMNENNDNVALPPI